MRVAVIGAGNFGTAVANVVARNGFETHLWMRDADQHAQMCSQRENLRYLPGHRLADNVEPSLDLEHATATSDVIYVTVPSASFRQVCEDFTPFVRDGAFVVSATKGIEENGFRLMSQILEQVIVQASVGVISGPNIAEELASGEITATVVASRDAALCDAVQGQLNSANFRCYKSDDVLGVELGGALKNVYGIISGMAHALEVGENTVAVLITRALAEMSRFAVSMGANPYTFLGLAGVGDLYVTSTSPLSRNYQLGAKLGAGATLDEAMNDLGKLAEGVNTVRLVRDQSRRLGVAMPLVEALYGLLFEGASLRRSIAEVVRREQEFVVEFASPTEWRLNQKD